jgi:hypothetical protein
MSAAFIGLDLAKSVFQVHGVGERPEIRGAGDSQFFNTDAQPCFGMDLGALHPQSLDASKRDRRRQGFVRRKSTSFPEDPL